MLHHVTWFVGAGGMGGAGCAAPIGESIGCSGFDLIIEIVNVDSGLQAAGVRSLCLVAGVCHGSCRAEAGCSSMRTRVLELLVSCLKCFLPFAGSG